MRFLLASIALAPTALALAIPAAPTTTPFAFLASAHASHHASAHHSTTAPFAFLASARASHHTNTHTPTRTKTSAPHPTHTQTPSESQAARMQQEIDRNGHDPHCPGGWTIIYLNGGPIQECNGGFVSGPSSYAPNLPPLQARAQIPSDSPHTGPELEDEELSGAVSKRKAGKENHSDPPGVKPFEDMTREEREDAMNHGRPSTHGAKGGPHP